MSSSRSHRIIRLAAASMLPLACAAAAQSDPPRVDGLFDEWSTYDPIATDASGDATGSFDVTRLFAMNRGTALYLRFDIGATLNMQAGSSSDGTLRVEFVLPSSQTLTIDMRQRRAYTDGNPNNSVPWPMIDYATGPTFAAGEFEARVDLAAFGVEIGDEISIDLSGSDALDALALFTLTEPADTPARRPAERQPDTDVRFASLNTLSNGLRHSTRGPRIARLVDAVAADVYCFQEESSSTPEQIAAILESIDPHGDGASWNVHQERDNVIASRSPVIEVPSENSRYAAAVVDLAPDPAVLVLSVHPSCCGYIGSSEDNARISQTQGMVTTISALREGSFGEELEPYRDAPVVVIGDWNLVGSRTPLDLLEDGPGLTHWLLPHLIAEEITTWRNDSSSFAPGLLDLVAHSPDSLSRRNGFVLDSAELNQDELDGLGLLIDDSGASDHLMLVTDFALGDACPADFNGDGEVDTLDVLAFLNAWNAGDSRADFNGDGAIDTRDVLAFLNAWNAGCP